MTVRFNLLDEPWLPVRFADGQVRDVGLLEVFERAGEIIALAETAPPSLIAEYRLLLAITHRALSRALGKWKDKERARWYRESLPHEALRDYLEQWRERFWVFHPEHPFMQVAALATLEETRDKEKPWTQISLASASGNTPAVFDHSVDPAPIPIAPAEALRHLLGFEQFTPGGLVQVLRTSDNGGPVSNTAAVIPVGANLQQTLCLGLHPHSPEEDLPSWERPAVRREDLTAAPSFATGPNDRYSRRSRAVLLLETETGQVQWVRFAAGVALAEDPNAPDPMASYHIGERPIRISFAEGRAFWRDLPSLLPDPAGKSSLPAAVLEWATNLNAALGELDREQPVLAAGLSSAKAKLERWRCEQLVLPAALLSDAELARSLRAEARRAEELHGAIRKVATSMLAATMPDPDHKDTRARARSIIDTGASAAAFFAAAERALPGLLRRVAQGDGEGANTYWAENLQRAAEACWESLRRDLGQRPQALRAEARAWPRFRGLLRELRGEESNPKPKEKEVNA